MVVFDEDGVEQAGAMVAAAAAVDGVFFESAPAGRCFAGVVNAGGGAFDAADVLARERGDSGQAADEIQQRPFAGEHVAGGAGEFGEATAGGDFIAIGGAGLPFDFGVHFVDEDRRGAQAGDDAGLAGDDRCPALRFGGDEGDGGPIVLAAEVFAHGEPDEVTEVVFEFGGPGLLGESQARGNG